ncbi:MBL fold metallo-hydrolase [Candidatus Pacearchaeota archaeon]|nr:MBL fold metallo-hydrolase [Candidatus Pacearchaeota archaeon]
MSLQIKIYDVNHGNAIHVKTPNDKDVMIDCGSNSSTGFSPSKHISGQQRSIDYLIVSHPHCDHISDIENFVGCHHPQILQRPEVSIEEILEANQSYCEDIIETYYEFQKSYNSPLEEGESPKNPEWGGGAKFINYSLEGETNLNNASKVSFLSYLNFTILFPGDIEESGWKKLLGMGYFKEWLKKTDILVASHHGRESGYCNEIFEYLNPYLTIVSDGRFSDTSATNRYSAKSLGWKIWNSDGEGIERKVLTTRYDGDIDIGVGKKQNGKTYISVSIT